MAAASAVAPLEEDKMRETILALIAVTLVSACSVTSAFAAGGMGGFAVGGYPASFGGNYAEGGGHCRLVGRRVMTQHGWRIRRKRVCS
jgi:hypothetical protein